MMVDPISFECAECCEDGCPCCSPGAVQFNITAGPFSNKIGSPCTDCTGVAPNRGWNRSAWKTLVVQAAAPCFLDSGFEQNTSTLNCSGVDQWQGARLEITCVEGVSVTYTLKLLADPSSATPPASMIVRATYVFTTTLNNDCRGPTYPDPIILNHSSDDGSCNYPATITMTHI